MSVVSVSHNGRTTHNGSVVSVVSPIEREVVQHSQTPCQCGDPGLGVHPTQATQEVSAHFRLESAPPKKKNEPAAFGDISGTAVRKCLVRMELCLSGGLQNQSSTGEVTRELVEEEAEKHGR